MIDEETKKFSDEFRAGQGGVLPKVEGREYTTTRVDDAFSTVMQWLQWRIPATRKVKGQVQAQVQAQVQTV